MEVQQRKALAEAEAAAAAAAAAAASKRRPASGPTGKRKREDDGGSAPAMKRATSVTVGPITPAAPSVPRNPYADSTLQERTVFVSNLGFQVTAERVREFLTTSGEIEAITLSLDNKGASRGFAHAVFVDVAGAEAALARDRDRLDGRPVFLSRFVNKLRGEKSGPPAYEPAREPAERARRLTREPRPAVRVWARCTHACDRFAKGAADNVVYTANLPFTWTEAQLQAMFAKARTLSDMVPVAMLAAC